MSKLIDIKSIATPEQWNDWHWQIKNRITTHAQLSKYIELQPEEEA
ncbi:MAG: lysine 2,3-aminomutase, partial [Candidatus Cloacimonadota bacterium]|nr:lysine 2,3-aminomutase [Candidatus Cloacimonadota bacterium]